jgi:hypothetical protein
MNHNLRALVAGMLPLAMGMSGSGPMPVHVHEPWSGRTRNPEDPVQKERIRKAEEKRARKRRTQVGNDKEKEDQVGHQKDSD